MARSFEKKTGNFSTKKDPIGSMLDSLMWATPKGGYVSSVVFRSPETYSGQARATPDAALHPVKNLTTEFIVRDLERIVRGTGGVLESTIVRDSMRTHGLDPDNMPNLSAKDGERLHNAIVQKLGREMRLRVFRQSRSDLEHALLVGTDDQLIELPRGTCATLGDIRKILPEVRGGTSIAEFSRLSGMEKDKVTERLDKYLRRRGLVTSREKMDEMRAARNTLHDWLAETWSRGPLVVERPRASWLHYLADWDERMSSTAVLARDLRNGDLQSILVENDWGASVPPGEGEWHLPFPDVAWEFQVSGVRIVAITTEDEKTPGDVTMVLVYGKGGVWVADGHGYNLSGGTVTSESHPLRGGNTTIRHVAKFCVAAVRSCCIMLDAEVAERVRVTDTNTAKAKAIFGNLRAAKNLKPLRDHYVVQLLRRWKHGSGDASRPGHPLSGGPRAPQRGHWRQGTWVHYDDPDSGQVQYPNDGGFLVSKTWRRWHFAGNPNNIIHKEYRL